MAGVEPGADTSDRQFMALALRLARRGTGRTSPNPAVGAVVVQGGRVVGTGWHRQAGQAHAEVLALEEAGPAAPGATLYVTLEPCCHQGRTPPCTGAVAAAGVRRVVVAMLDPDPRVGGRGIGELASQGIAVAVGPGGPEAERLNEAYLLHRRLGRPFVTYKAAASLDGRTAAADGTSRWITGPAARRDVHRLRSASDAICVGIGTVLKDDPSLTVREVRSDRPPLRVVVDSLARTPPGARVLDGAAPTLVTVSDAAPAAAVTAIEARGAEVARLPAAGGRLALGPLLACLAERGIVSLLLEGGAILAGAFAAAGLVDRYVFYLAPKLLGGEGTAGLLEGWAAAGIGDARPLALGRIRRLGPDLRLEARPAGLPGGSGAAATGTARGEG